AFLARAVELEGRVAALTLPPRGEREGAEAKLEVLYDVDAVRHSASGVRTHAEYAEGLGRGSVVKLLVDPRMPDKPREATYVRERARTGGLVPWGLGLGALVAVGLFARELRRTLRAELEPLRKGMLVWLTPEGPLPESRREELFPASFRKEEQKLAV